MACVTQNQGGTGDQLSFQQFRALRSVLSSPNLPSGSDAKSSSLSRRHQAIWIRSSPKSATKPKPTAKGFHVSTHCSDRGPVYIGVLHLRNAWFGSAHLLGNVSLCDWGSHSRWQARSRVQDPGQHPGGQRLPAAR